MPVVTTKLHMLTNFHKFFQSLPHFMHAVAEVQRDYIVLSGLLSH